MLTASPVGTTIQSMDVSPLELSSPSLQEQLAPSSICFGCGPANSRGLRIRSYRHQIGLRTVFQPLPQHQAFHGVVNGGIIGTVVDCHGNWTAAVALMDLDGAATLPSTVTARFEVELIRTTPFGLDMEVTSRIAELDADARRVDVLVEVHVGGRLTARGRGLFVEVEPGHPAYHRWDAGS